MPSCCRPTVLSDVAVAHPQPRPLGQALDERLIDLDRFLEAPGVAEDDALHVQCALVGGIAGQHLVDENQGLFVAIVEIALLGDVERGGGEGGFQFERVVEQGFALQPEAKAEVGHHAQRVDVGRLVKQAGAQDDFGGRQIAGLERPRRLGEPRMGDRDGRRAHRAGMQTRAAHRLLRLGEKAIGIGVERVVLQDQREPCGSRRRVVRQQPGALAERIFAEDRLRCGHR